MPRTRKPAAAAAPLREARRAYLLTNRADPALAAILLRHHAKDPGGALSADLRRRFAAARTRARRTGVPIHRALDD